MVVKQDRVEDIINNYLKPDNHPMMVERIHRRTFDEEKEFDTWEEVEETYLDRDWDQDTFDVFVRRAQEVVDGGEKRIPESYFNIVEPENVSIETITSSFEEKPFNPDVRGKDREGFKYTVDDNNVVRATYVFVNEKTDLTANGEVDTLVSEGSISYLIDPSRQLLIAQSTYPPYIQKTKSIFNKKTELQVAVLGDLTSNHTHADDQLEQFLGMFDRKDLEENNE